ncbi:MAG: 4Fe-4S dicluster domain-containing protein, partial [Proteobacteria bacterium]|nr:4Fe-4S dicluster domain-containing protein [Pseudomonadota bacterium]
YGLATYGNAGWLREQVCMYMCPYARFQSSMFDRDTLVISYDEKRGEPRGPLGKEPQERTGLGDCIDCTMCVQVCPTGIDIRKGLQYECIGCAACIDACDTVMDKIDKPRGLIRYTTENALQNGLSLAQIKKRALRPRVLIYGALLLLVVAVTFGSLLTRTSVKLDVLRDRGVMGREVEDGMIENVYRLQIMNTDEASHRFQILVDGIDTIKLATPNEVWLESTGSRILPLKIRVDHGKGKPGSNPIHIEVRAIDNDRMRTREKAVFFVPR